MIVKKIISNKEYIYKFDSTFQLEKKFSLDDFDLYKEKSEDDKLIISFKSDKEFKRMKLLIILSPIFIASFDNGTNELDFFKGMLQKSNFTFGLYENFFQNFNLKEYLDFYKSHDKLEDIMLDKNFNVKFTLNLIDNKYMLALISLIEGLILDEKTCDNLLDYFAKIRNDIVINGRRSILANGIQAFYLSKYVVVWALDLYKIIEENHPDLYCFIEPIYKLTNNLKRPGDI